MNTPPWVLLGGFGREKEMKLYLIASYEQKSRIQMYAEIIKEQISRIQVVSTWHSTPWQEEGALSQAELASLADQALFELNLSDAVLIFTEPADQDARFKRGGRHVEFGYALRMQKAIYLIGPRENIFYHLPEIIHFKSWAMFCSYVIRDSVIEA